MARASSEAAQKRQARNERRREQTRVEILDAACELLLRDGMVAFTLAAVAKELGLTNPALYYYFDSREALLFELMRREWFASAEEIEAAVEATETGADAVEALMRTFFDRYRDRLPMFRLVHQSAGPESASRAASAEELERIRPVNDMLYGGAEKRLRADQRKGRFPKSRNARRFAFTAHMATIGVLNMKVLTAAANDPLIHGDDDLIDDLCLTFRQAATAGGRK